MKKYVCVIALLLGFFGKNIAQEIAIENKELSKTTLYDFELTDKQYATWKSIKNNWIVSDFEKIEAENKIKLNCKNCESFYVDVIIKINANGKMEYYKLINGKKCGIDISKQLELRVMRNFFKFEFPAELRNVTFQTRLGNALKC